MLLKAADFKSTVYTISPPWLVLGVRIELTSQALQASVVTTSTTQAYLFINRTAVFINIDEAQYKLSAHCLSINDTIIKTA